MSGPFPTPGQTSVRSFETSGGARIFQIPLREFPMLLGYVYLVMVDAAPQGQYRVLIDTGSGFADSNRDLRKAEAVFRQLIAEFPSSHYKSQAEFILGLQVQIDKLRSDVKERDDRIKKLSEELKVLKEIDLQRRPSRPE